MNHQDFTEVAFNGVHGRDEFRRVHVAEKVINLLTASIDLSPMVIDGDWGTGKTEFCHKLMNKFRDDHPNYRLLYIDAFQADHADNPLLTLLSGVISLLPEGNEKNALRNKAMPVIRFAAAAVGKAVVSHVLRQNADDLMGGLEENIQDAADQAIDASVKALLKDHEDAQKNIQALQAALANITKNNPIVIFIDELDRCRPDFAVQILEVIKHTFNTKGLQFVLVTNTRQLKAAINHRYGTQVNAQRYLDKFLKFSFRLPEFIIEQNGNSDNKLLAASKHFALMLDKSEILKETHLKNTNLAIHIFCKDLIEINNLSLREVETFVKHLEIYNILCNGLNAKTKSGYLFLRIIGVFAFCFHPEASQAIAKRIADADRLMVMFNVTELPDIRSKKFQQSHIQDVAIIIAQDSAINSQKYTPSANQTEEVKYWNECRNRYFQDNWGLIEHTHTPIRQAIHCLQFGEL